MAEHDRFVSYTRSQIAEQRSEAEPPPVGRKLLIITPLKNRFFWLLVLWFMYFAWAGAQARLHERTSA